MKEKLLLVMPMTLGLFLLCLTMFELNSFGKEDASVEPVYVTSYTVESNNVGSLAISETTDSLASNGEVVTVMRMQPTVLAKPEETVQVSGVSMITNHGEHIVTDTIEVEVDNLMTVYYEDYETPDWDDKNKISIIATLWEFLVNQQGMDPRHAAAILGNIMVEGSFAEEQGSYDIISDMEEMRAVLGCGNKGYGVVQWTYHTRQDALLAYYDLAYEMYPDDWDKVKVIAECSMLLEEIKAFGIFDNIYEANSLEDSVGRVCVLYENFNKARSAWTIVDGEYVLSSNIGSSDERYAYAQAIYDYFTE